MGVLADHVAGFDLHVGHGELDLLGALRVYGQVTDVGYAAG